MSDPIAGGVEALARALARGEPVDWDAAEAAAPSDAERRLVRHLRIVDGIARLHSTLRTSDDSVPSAESEGNRDAPEPVIGRWGPLELLEQVGSGAYGEVYRAWDTRLHREVALKLLHASASADATAHLAEARALARVRHPNVVTIHGADVFNGRAGLWMEFVSGRTLDAIVRRDGRFSADEAANVGAAVCRALSAVHQAGSLHRDVKAQNVMRESGGRIVLMDFGTGIDAAADSDRGDLAAGASTPRPRLTGTPLYLAPEVLRHEPPGVASDIYSVGVLLFFMVTGTYPVTGQDLEAVRIAHQRAGKRRLRDLRSDLPAAFVDIVERAVAERPAARYESAGALEAALTAFAGGAGARHIADNTRGRSVARGRRIPVLAGATVAAAALVVLSDVVGVRSRTLALFGTSTSVAHRLTGLQLRELNTPPAMYVGPPSPDGTQLAFVDVEGDLALYELASGQSRRLTSKGDSTERAEASMAFSRDGAFLAYTWVALDGAAELRVIGTDGRKPRVLLRHSDIAFPAPLHWSSDGSRILCRLESGGGGAVLAMLDLDTGATSRIADVAAIASVAMSPDDQFVAFDEVDEATGRTSISMVRTRDGARVSRIEHPGHNMHPVWLRDGTLIFASDRSGSLGLWRVHPQEGRLHAAPESLHRDIGRYFPLGATDARTLFFQLQSGIVDVHTARLDFAGDTLVHDVQPIAPSSVGNSMSAAWSADGRVLAYTFLRGLSYRAARALVMRDLSTGIERVLHPRLADYLMPLLSPDGASILVRGTTLDGMVGLFIIDAATGAIRRAITRVETGWPSPPGSAAWSPDGGAVWFNQPNVGIVSLAPANGERHIVLDYRKEGLSTLEWSPGAFRVSPDGSLLAYVGFVRDASEPTLALRVKPIGSSEAARELLRSASEIIALQPWSPDGRELLVTKHPRGGRGPRRNELWRVPVDGTEPRPTGFAMNGLRYLELSPDGRSLAFTAGAPLIRTWVLEGLPE
jgi:Tol biopolymer transport system component